MVAVLTCWGLPARERRAMSCHSAGLVADPRTRNQLGLLDPPGQQFGELEKPVRKDQLVVVGPQGEQEADRVGNPPSLEGTAEQGLELHD